MPHAVCSAPCRLSSPRPPCFSDGAYCVSARLEVVLEHPVVGPRGVLHEDRQLVLGRAVGRDVGEVERRDLVGPGEREQDLAVHPVPELVDVARPVAEVAALHAPRDALPRGAVADAR